MQGELDGGSSLPNIMFSGYTGIGSDLSKGCGQSRRPKALTSKCLYKLINIERELVWKDLNVN